MEWGKGSAVSDQPDKIPQFLAVRPTQEELRWMRRGLNQPGGKIPVFDESDTPVDPKIVLRCLEQQWVEPWVGNQKNPNNLYMACRLSPLGRRLCTSEPQVVRPDQKVTYVEDENEAGLDRDAKNKMLLETLEVIASRSKRDVGQSAFLGKTITFGSIAVLLIAVPLVVWQAFRVMESQQAPAIGAQVATTAPAQSEAAPAPPEAAPGATEEAAPSPEPEPLPLTTPTEEETANEEPPESSSPASPAETTETAALIPQEAAAPEQSSPPIISEPEPQAEEAPPVISEPEPVTEPDSGSLPSVSGSATEAASSEEAIEAAAAPSKDPQTEDPLPLEASAATQEAEPASSQTEEPAPPTAPTETASSGPSGSESAAEALPEPLPLYPWAPRVEVAPREDTPQVALPQEALPQEAPPQQSAPPDQKAEVEVESLPPPAATAPNEPTLSSPSDNAVASSGDPAAAEEPVPSLDQEAVPSTSGITAPAPAAPEAQPAVPAPADAQPAIQEPEPKMVELAVLPPVKPEPPAPAPAPAPAPTATPTATVARTGEFGVQLAASPVEADARRLLSKISEEQEELLGAYPLEIIRAEIEGKGTFYRVRTLPFGDRSQASALCSALKGAGQDCFVFPLGR
jgi:hypothetical protein